MATNSESITGKITTFTNQINEQVDFMRSRAVVLDAEKGDIDSTVNKLDLVIQSRIDSVNNDVKNVAIAYDARISAGCRTLKNWSSTGITTDVGTGIESEGYVCIIDNAFKQNKNLHGIKYYEEPHSVDIINAASGSFIGTVGAGSTVITIMSIAGTGVTSNMEVGNIITCSQAGVFAGVTTIVGFSTSVADLSPIGIGSTGDIEVVDTIITSIAVAVAVTAASATQFDVLGFSTSLSIPPVSMTKNPLTPQSIGIMQTTTSGIGTYIVYDNSGNPSSVQSWNQFLNGIKIKKAVVSEPVVGAGITIYNVGTTQAPSIGGVEANVGDTILITPPGPPPYISLPSCPTQEANLTAALSTLTTSESQLISGNTSILPIITTSNVFRALKRKYTLQIWGIRQTLSELYHEQDELNTTAQYLTNTDVLKIIDS